MAGAGIKEASDPTRETVGHDISKELQQLRADIASLSASVQRYGALQAEELKARAKDLTDDALDESLRSVRELRQKVDSLHRRLEEDVGAHPLASLAGALGLGLLFGLLFARRN